MVAGYNYFQIIGQVEKVDTDKKEIVVAVQRPFKNLNNQYEVDRLPIRLGNLLIELLKDTELVGKAISVKGTSLIENEKIVMLAERLLFLGN